MRFSQRYWRRVYFKVGTLPGLYYFVAKADWPKLIIGGMLKIRTDDGRTKPEYQHTESVLIDEIRNVGGTPLYIAARF